MNHKDFVKKQNRSRYFTWSAFMSTWSTLLIAFTMFVGLGPAKTAEAYYANGQAAAQAVGQTNTDGSSSYTSSTPNNPVNVGLNNPEGTAVDGSRHLLYVADTNNHRVLVYALNTDNSLPDYKADYVVGQAGFSATNPNRGGSSPAINSLRSPSRVAVELASGNVYVSDTGNNRVLIFAAVTIIDPNALHVIGASNFTTTNANGTVSNTQMLSPAGVAFSGSGGTLKIYIADRDFNRVLIFNQITTDGQGAVNVLGQGTFIESSAALSQNGMASPAGLHYSGAGYLYVADSSNNRVLVWTSPITGNGQNANLVLGQTWFYSNGSGASSSTFNRPADIVVTTNGNTYVSDSNNNRVLVWNTAITTSGQAANLVLGQSSFSGTSQGATPTRENYPLGLAAAGSYLYISDSQNNRVIGYASTVSSSGQSASFVLGQLSSDGSVDFYGNTFNNPQNTGLNNPTSVAIDTANHLLFASDTNNNRVLVYTLNAANQLLDFGADYVLGQPNFSLTAANQGGAVSA
ncbi:MAG: putative haloacid dehalogenase-like hydrolase family protein, partial [Candidatus Saccharibacteria bacterium]|nr:putative haloacid dehalogenase-like hydrolase family protein [Candidatus Saccharibacteria bacterium]